MKHVLLVSGRILLAKCTSQDQGGNKLCVPLMNIVEVMQETISPYAGWGLSPEHHSGRSPYRMIIS